jgi:hypothetical protein
MPTKEPNPLLRPLLALAELLLDDDDVHRFDEEQARKREQRRRKILIEGFRRESPYDVGIGQWETISDLERQVGAVLSGAGDGYFPDEAALDRSEALAEKLVARVFDLSRQRLEVLAPEAAAASKARAAKARKEADEKRKAGDKAKRERAKKKAGKKAPAKKGAKKTAKGSPTLKQGAAARREAAWRDKGKAKGSPAKKTTKKASAKANGAAAPDPRQTSLVDDAGAHA